MSAGQDVLTAIAAERQEARELIERLDAAEAAIKGKKATVPPRLAEAAAAARSGPKRPKRQRKRGKAGSTSLEAALERRTQVHRFIHEQDGLVAPKDVVAALGISANEFRTASTKLVEAGKIRREGERQFTRYESIAEPEGGEPAGGPPPMPSRENGGTLQGRILDAIEQRDGFATLDQIAETTGEGQQALNKECGLLIREEELRMDRRDGAVGYTLTN